MYSNFLSACYRVCLSFEEAKSKPIFSAEYEKANKDLSRELDFLKQVIIKNGVSIYPYFVYANDNINPADLLPLALETVRKSATR